MTNCLIGRTVVWKRDRVAILAADMLGGYEKVGGNRRAEVAAPIAHLIPAGGQVGVARCARIAGSRTNNDDG